MTKVLVTGFNSKQANPDKNSRDVMISWMIAEICRDLGYDVEHRNPTIEESYEEFNHVFMGMAPLHSLGSNRVYGALSCYLKCYPDGKLTLYQDDPQNQNVTNGISTVFNDPNRLIKLFFNYKLEYKLANTPEWHKYLMQAVEVLHEYAWPTTIVPMFPWGDIEKLTRKCPKMIDPVGIDFSSFLPHYDVELLDDRKKQWVAEMTDEKWFHRQRTNWHTLQYGRHYNKRPDDMGLLRAYGESWAVLDRGLDNGWWTSRMGYAAQTATVFSTEWKNVRDLGDAYDILPYTVEGLSNDERRELTLSQIDAFNKFTTPREDVKETIRKMVEKNG